MFDNLEITLVKIEGLGNITKATCFISVNNTPLDSVLLENLETIPNIFSVPPKAQIMFMIYDQKKLASVKFNLNIIKCQGYHWFPLFTEEFDVIYEVPEEVGLPRILLVMNSKQFLSPVIEITETSEMSENVEILDYIESQTEEIHKNVELRLSIMELERVLQTEKNSYAQNIEKLSREHKAEIEKINFEVEKQKIILGKYKEKCDLLNEEMKEKERLIFDIKNQIEISSAELNLYKNKQIEILTSQESMYQIIESKEKEINDLKQRINNRIYKKLEITFQFSINVPATEKNSQVFKKTLFSDYEAKKTQKPKKRLIEKHSLNSTIGENQFTDETLDFLLSESLCRLKLEGFLTKCKEHYYKIGSRKIGVVLKNGNIFCKVGESFKTLENYIYTHCNKELDTFIKKKLNTTQKKPGHGYSKSFDNTLNSTQKSVSFKGKSENIVKVIKKVKSTTPPLLVKSLKK